MGQFEKFRIQYKSFLLSELFLVLMIAGFLINAGTSMLPSEEEEIH